MKILRLSAENIKRLSVVEITPDGRPVVVIGGKNGAGKSSVLDAIEMALGGANSTPGKPVRIGQDRAKVVVDLGDIVVTRTFTAAGGGSLVVANKEGARYTSPQAMLDSLIGKLSFDPLAFERQTSKQQRDTLRALVGLNTDDLDQQHADLFRERALVNKTVSNLTGHLAGLTVDETVPAAEISFTDLMAELAAAEQNVRTLDKARSAYKATVKEFTLAVEAAAAVKAHLVELRAQVEALEARAAAYTQEIHAKEQAVHAAKAAGIALEAAKIDPEPIRQRIFMAETINASVRGNLERQKIVEARDAEQATAKAMTEQLAAIEREKAERVRAVTFPVPGLGIDADGVTLDEVPFEQASQAQRLRASVAIGLALNPELKVLLVREGSALDATSLALLSEMAAKADAQVWLEAVQEAPDGVSVYIEDGAVKADVDALVGAEK